ncbi:MAG TPA: aspartate kinase [Sphingobacteriaceae bacterium]|nr:aspartate kinase [Sphingobacteriaceae bacterium]
MQVFKFGGASVKDAAGVKNLAGIIELNQDQKLLIVVSAMGKITNALEKLTEAYVNRDHNVHQLFSEIINYHNLIIQDLFPDNSHPVYDDIANAFVEIDWMLEDEPPEDYDFNYDQIVSIGEIISTKIVSAYLNYKGLKNQWIDVRSFIHTDNTYREGVVIWDRTSSSIQNRIPKILEDQFIVTQGFLGGTSENFTTTLGREGSDYTAAIFASCLNAENVTIWKDVPGILNADPKLFNETKKYNELPYSEALEMTFYGACVIHPKTIKPLQNANIPLHVRPFMAPEETGTVVRQSASMNVEHPAIIVKQNQALVSIASKDYSFISEIHLSQIFKAFADSHLKINMMQVSALSFSLCFDWDERRFKRLSEFLDTDFKLRYNSGLELLTVRHYKRNLLDDMAKDRTVLIEQFSRNTAQLVVSN